MWCRVVGFIFFGFFLGEYGDISLDEAKYFGFEVLWWGLKECG